MLAAVVTLPILLLRPLQHRPSELIGIWRGTSTCTDRVAAPACNDETIVYEFTAGQKPEIVHWKADKVVAGKREAMGELDLTYDTGDGCWRAEFSSPRRRVVWCLSVSGAHMNGSAWLLPGKEKVRKIDADKEPNR